MGGWVPERFGAFPAAGDSVDWESLSVTVLNMDGRRVDKLLVRKKEQK